jgi:CBS-domain-containing membrane protein
MENIANRDLESTRSRSVPTKEEIPISLELVLQQQQQLKQYQKQLEGQQQQINRLINELSHVKSRNHAQKWNYQGTLEKFNQYFSKIHGSSKYQPRYGLKQISFSYISSFIGIAALAYISVNTNYPLIAAPFGAAAVLLFAASDSPLAQPRNCIFGNCLGAIVSLVMVHLFGSEPWVMALAVATTIKIMQLTKTLHPPGGAVALVGVMSHAEWSFLFTPVLAGSIVLVICTTIFNNLIPGRSYPKHWL